MKQIKYFILSVMLFSISACNDKEWLKENPLDFYAPENSFTTTAQFQQSLNGLYDQVRNMIWNSNGDLRMAFYTGTDFGFPASDYPDAKLNNYSATVTPTWTVTQLLWTAVYLQIANANAILDHLELPNQVGASDKAIIKGEALFFRAFAYRILANLYGGVPLITEQISSPRRDFVRASRDEVYAQCKKDLEEAVKILPNIEKVKDGKVSKQAAQHLLSEIYISLKTYTEAINAATSVINYNGMGLMKTRFGSRKTDPADVYWDLFREENQNRAKSGNTESILVLQYDYLNAGSSYSVFMPRFAIPEYYNGKVSAVGGGTVSTFTAPTDAKCGRGIGVLQGTYFYFNTLWGKDFKNDMRNSSNNIIRDFRIDNPKAVGFGKWLVADGYLNPIDTIRRWYPFSTKVARIGNFPADSYLKDASGARTKTALGEYILNASLANGSYKDEYLFRLAETYLLRAEAYLGNNQKDKAAEDINAVRNRANASSVTAADVTIDYILDERLRELSYEELRILTLTRLGKQVERTRKYNPSTGNRILDHQNLWPIPYGEIEKNVNGKLEQNPGYN